MKLLAVLKISCILGNAAHSRPIAFRFTLADSDPVESSQATALEAFRPSGCTH